MEKRTLIVQGLLGLAGFLFFSGCEDPQSRSLAKEAKESVDKVKVELGQIGEDLRAFKTQAQTAQAELSKRVEDNHRLLNEALTKGQTELTQKISETLDKSLKQSKNMNDQLQTEFSNSLKNKVEVDVAQDFQKIRDQIEKNRQELLGFMDEKLKELYPYAYQPRRKDPSEPPATPQP